MSSYSVKRPITVLMGILIVIVLGIFSVSRLPLTLFPDVNLPFVVTITPYPGANPQEVESEISNRIESAAATIGNFESVTSMSNENFAVSFITFAQSSNMDSIVIEMRELLNNITFAENVGNTRILRLSPDLLPVMTVTLFRSYDEELSDDEALIRNTEWITRDIMTELLSIPGVADVTVNGAADIVLQVNLDDALLTQYGLTAQGVIEIIEKQNAGGLIGVALDEGEIRFLYLGDRPQTLEEIKKLPITVSLGSIIRLEDLASGDGIRFINANTNVYSKVNGTQGIQISFQKQSDVGITEVTRNIMSRLDRIVENEGENANYRVLLNQGEFITQSINSVLQNIIVGGLLAIIILFVFLKDIKPTIVVGLAIPISVIASFMMMYFTNVSLNLISMGGLALGIGMLVDNAVVVIENIFRMISEGKSKSEAAIEGSKQVAGAITASTFTTIAVFLPIAFIEGLIAEVFISMALTIAYSLGSSLIIALTLVPALSSRILNDKKDRKEGKVIKKAKNVYKTSVLFTLKHKSLTLLTVLLLLVLSIFLVSRKGFILLPASDEGIINISIETTSQTSFNDKVTFADELTAILVTLDDVETLSASIGSQGGFFGGGMMGGGSGNAISFTVNLKEQRAQTTDQNKIRIEDIIKTFDYDKTPNFTEDNILEVSIASQNSTGGFGGAQGINIKISGYDLQTLEKISNEITQIVATTDGVKSADNGINQGANNIKIEVNKDQAMLLGLTSQDVLEQVNFLFGAFANLGQAQQVTVFIEGIHYVLDIPQEAFGNISLADFGTYEVFMRGIRLFDAPTLQMINTYLDTPNAMLYIPNYPFLETYIPFAATGMIINPFLRISNGEIILDFNPFSALPSLESLSIAPLFDVDNPQTSLTTVGYVTGFATIYTDGSNRFLTVTGQVEDGKNITIVSSEVNQRVRTYLSSEAFTQYGSGYTVEFEGENEEIIKAIIELSLAALVAILLVYMVMAIQFQSLLYPFIILGTIPLAFTGGMLALLLTNSYLSLVSVMGFIILIGIVVNNGIVLIDYINKLREKGLTVKDAIVEAGQTRLRPIFMTALTTILALFTLALGFGEGAELLQPMAITAIGGLIYATLLTLVVVPTIYAAFNGKTMRLEEDNKDATN